MRCWGIILAFWLVVAGAAAQAEQVSLIEIDGAIGPATASYIARAIDEAAASGAQCLIIQLDTPGGLLDSTKKIIQSFLGSPIPIVVYVAPAGAWAGSAGCFITMAADVAAMAPATSIGAAHPVSIGGGGGGEDKKDDVMKQKMENFATSYIEAVAARHGRNAEWAKSAVRESASVTAEKALELNVIDLLADDREALLQQIDGREVRGKKLATAGVTPTPIAMTPRERVFQMVWRPEVMFVLMLVVVYGIIGELSNPGAILPGVIGAIALVLLLYMASVIPMNIAGIALIVLAIGLFVIDIFAPTHGILTGGGIIAFFLGSLMLFDRSQPFLRVSLSVLVIGTLVTAAFFVVVAGAGVRAQFWPVRSGREAMIGRPVQVLARVDAEHGKVFVDGEYWNAISAAPIEPGQDAEIVGLEGLRLRVKPKSGGGTS
jgi:membrane-bound serine protease (ClpP class)